MEYIGDGWVAVVWDRCAVVREVMLERLLQCGFDAREVERAEDLPEALQDAAATGQGLLLASSPESLPSVETWHDWRARWPAMKTLLCAASPRRDWPGRPDSSSCRSRRRRRCGCPPCGRCARRRTSPPERRV
ncbi:hypothetical protein ACQ859_02900 [Roseateles chitinivorans]|uniref:hypothetical protein n=1 Tax=Roseateles chitinivorans TaxID=2917965 RepID=UPI003D673CB5